MLRASFLSVGRWFDKFFRPPRDAAKGLSPYRVARESSPGEFFKMAKAHLGEADWQNFLGGLYDRGENVPQDYAEAMKWYRLVDRIRRFDPVGSAKRAEIPGQRAGFKRLILTTSS
jgi:TPR repeat protein